MKTATLTTNNAQTIDHSEVIETAFAITSLRADGQTAAQIAAGYQIPEQTIVTLFAALDAAQTAIDTANILRREQDTEH